MSDTNYGEAGRGDEPGLSAGPSTGGHGHGTGATNSGVAVGPDYDATTDPSGRVDSHLPHGVDADGNELDADGNVLVREPAGVVAEFSSPQAMLDAASALREAGYRKFDTYSPYPVHGSDEAVGIRPTILPWIVLCAALFGAANALGMIYFMNKADYPYQISGKPLFALPPSMPITFELTVLFSAITAFLCVIVLSNLPRFNNPLLRAKSFARATDDRFVVAVDARDKAYGEATSGVLQKFSPASLETVMTEPGGKSIPVGVWFVLTAVAVLALFPLAWAGVKRNSYTEEPRIHPIQDMDFQPRYNAQQAISPAIAADGKAAFAPVLGTRPYRGADADVALLRGIKPSGGNPMVSAQEEETGEEAAAGAAETDTDAPDQTEAGDDDRPQGTDGSAIKDAAKNEPAVTGEGGSGAAKTPAGGSEEVEGVAKEPDWVTTFPVEVTDALMARGQERYNIYCTPCHGLGGDGDGLVTKRAMSLEQGTWVLPVSFHASGPGSVRDQPVGRIYNTITNGIRKMPGYADQIPVEDRWAIVLYIRALQRSRVATEADADPEIIQDLRAVK